MKIQIEGLQTRATELRDSDATTGSAILGWLHDVTSQKPAAKEVELFRVQKGDRELRGIAVYLPTGIDLRLMERRRVQVDAVVRGCPDPTRDQRGLARPACPGRVRQTRRRFRQEGPALGTASTPNDEWLP